MSLRKSLLQQGLKLVGDPRVLKLVQSEQIMKAVMIAISVPAKLESLAKDQAERLAKTFALATSDEVRDLKRTVRSLEEQVAELRSRRP